MSVVKQPKALLWHCVLYSNLGRGHGMYFLWTVTNDYHLSDKKSPWQRLYHSKTSRWVARIWSSIHIHYRVMWQNVTNRKWRHSKYWAGISYYLYLYTGKSFPSHVTTSMTVWLEQASKTVMNTTWPMTSPQSSWRHYCHFVVTNTFGGVFDTQGGESLLWSLPKTLLRFHHIPYRPAPVNNQSWLDGTCQSKKIL